MGGGNTRQYKITHKYSDKVVDTIWGNKSEVSQNRNLVVSGIRLADNRYGVRLVEESKIQKSRGEFVLATNNHLRVILKKFNTYNKQESIQFFYHTINTLLNQYEVRESA